MYFWLFLNIASDDTKTLFATLTSLPEGGSSGEGAAIPLPLLFRNLLGQGLARKVVFQLGEHKEVCKYELRAVGSTVANEKCDSHVCLLSSNFILAYKLNFH